MALHDSPFYPPLVVFGLLLGHLVGDYVLQNDWLAKHKTTPHPGPRPKTFDKAKPEELEPLLGEWNEYDKKFSAYWLGHLACMCHCFCYTIAVQVCSLFWLPTWALVACCVLHFPVDRFRLAAWWMKNVSGQKEFATGALSPWSIIVVDNIFHLLVLFTIALVVVIT